MRGYFGIMSSSSSSECDLQCNGEKVDIKKQSHLWQPKETKGKEEPLWHLRISVLKDQEGRGDAPSRRFAFKSMHHLTHAANQLESAFATSFDMRKCGCDTPDAMGGRVNDGRCENITIEYDSETAKEGWTEFLGRLKTLEDEWEHEGISHL
ncbi:hypothetical protein BGZ60DRAFT_374224 [Tricladium varicosporioides]|nr:hypothetical protein BGZ60DRAFT_374224 [Hymenoscyphus varicosporioides]